MIKQEILSFELCADGHSGAVYTTPISVARELLGAGAAPRVNKAALIASSSLGKTAVLKACFTVNGLMYSMRRVVLRLRRTARSYVRLNGKEIGVTFTDRDTTLDVKELLHIGNNTLEIEMNAKDRGDDPLDLSLGSVELVGFNHDIITSVFVSSELRGESVRFRISAETFEAGGATRAVATLVSPGGRVYYCGMSSGTGEIDITEPNPWWPSLLGVQNLYRLTVNLYADGEVIDSADMRVGLCRLLMGENNPCGLPTLSFNGTNFYMKAVCYYPDDLFLPMLDRERIKTNLYECARSGFNTVIVKDCGKYPGAEFFDVCDELGLIAIPELASDGNLSAFLEAYRSEAYHVSFRAVLLTGGARETELPDFLADKARLSTESLDSIAEWGRATLPGERSLCDMLSPDDMNLNSYALSSLSELSDNAELLSGLLYRFPSGLREAYYAVSLTEADRLSEVIGKTRRSRPSAMYSVMPRLSDAAPTVSRSLVDRYGRRKPHCYALSRLFAPAYVGAVSDGTRVTFFISNESREAKTFKFSYAVCAADGRAAFRDAFTVTAEPFSSMDILTSDFGEIVGESLDEYYVSYSISDSFITVSRGTLLFTPPKFFKLRRPNIRTEISGGGSRFILTLSSDVFAKGVEISFGDTAVSIEDNYFDITDRSPVRIDLETEHATAIEVLRRELRVRSAYDIGREPEENE
ncbi:MAG: hypothetical protein IJW48_03580 [Clostridia bacterium]|nr:hypothetical protein [Clostridia bacterium]